MLLETLHILVLVELEIQKQPSLNIKMQLEDIQTLVKILSKAYTDVKFAAVAQLPLELAIIEWTLGQKSISASASLPNELSSISTARGPVSSFPPVSARSSFSADAEPDE